MSHSIEMGSHFHKARRLAKIVAPDFRIFATENLDPGQCVLDLRAKTIEIGERTRELQAAAAILFQAGHLRLRTEEGFDEHFGKITIVSEKRLIKRLREQGQEADMRASDWAIEALSSNWNIDKVQAKSLIDPYVWDDTEWGSYYSGE